MTDSLATITRDLPWLRALAVRLARGDLDAADDLVQDTLHVAWDRAPPEAALHSPRGWLATVLRNRLRMRKRGEARRAAREDQVARDATVDAPAPIDELARLELLGFVMDRLQALPELDRRIITLRFFSELDATAIGQHLSLPPATVRSRLHRALARLRDEVDARHAGDRQAWALLLGVPSQLTHSPPLGALAMTTAAKLTIAVAVAAVATVGWVSTRPAPTPSATRAPVVATPTPAPIQEPAGERAWTERRASIRDRIGARPAPDVPAVAAVAADDEALIAQARQALHDSFAACTEDRAITGTISIRATIIGSPDVGTIFESIEPLDPATRDAEVLECLIESSYAYVGPAPRAAIDSTTTMAWLGAPPQDLDPEAWRREMFTATTTSHLAELRACQSGAAITGALSLRFEFTEDPLPAAVHAEPGDIPDEVVQCALTAARGWRFPRKFAGQTMTSSFHFPIDPAVDGPSRDD